MAACILEALPGGCDSWSLRLEELEVDAAAIGGGWAERFMDDCGVGRAHIAKALREAREIVAHSGTAVVVVRMGEELAEVRVTLPPAITLPIREPATAGRAAAPRRAPRRAGRLTARSLHLHHAPVHVRRLPPASWRSRPGSSLPTLRSLMAHAMSLASIPLGRARVGQLTAAQTCVDAGPNGEMKRIDIMPVTNDAFVDAACSPTASPASANTTPLADWTSWTLTSWIVPAAWRR